MRRKPSCGTQEGTSRFAYEVIFVNWGWGMGCASTIHPALTEHNSSLWVQSEATEKESGVWKGMCGKEGGMQGGAMEGYIVNAHRAPEAEARG